MKKIIISLFIILVLAGTGYYFSNDILGIYQKFTKDIQDFEKTDVGNIIKEVSKDFFNPPPLKIKGKPSTTVLSKAGIISETNLQRQKNGLGFLIEDALLDSAAAAKANDMFKNQYFEHISPTGVDPGQLVLNYGYKYIVAGENLILGNFDSEKELVQAWMDSPGHRANILNNRYSEIGVAIIKGNYKGEQVWMGVQEFGLPLSACIEPSITLKNKIGEKKTLLDQMSEQLDLEKIRIENANPRSQQYNDLVDNYNLLVSQYQLLADEIKNLISQYNDQVNVFNQCVKGTNSPI
ncbi:MAG: CAP domain-containing protein [Patescibacteria group bacterium]